MVGEILKYVAVSGVCSMVTAIVTLIYSTRKKTSLALELSERSELRDFRTELRDELRELRKEYKISETETHELRRELIESRSELEEAKMELARYKERCPLSDKSQCPIGG